MPDTPLIYLDACIYLDLITRNNQLQVGTERPRWKSAKIVFDALAADQVKLAASALLEAEVLCNGETRARSERSEQVRNQLHSWFVSHRTHWVDIDRFLTQQAIALRQEYGHLRQEGERPFSAADALHLAAAVRLKCDYFMSQDDSFPYDQTIDKTRIIRPDFVWQPGLFDDHGEE